MDDMYHKEFTPFTERSNPLTLDFDALPPELMILKLKEADSEIFSVAYGGFPGLMSSEVILKLEKLSGHIAWMLTESTEPVFGKVVLTGCGSSGRLAYCTAKKYNRILGQLGYFEILSTAFAGGNEALFSSKENSEDNPCAGVSDLMLALNSQLHGRSLVVGVSCGLSAPYVAGQIKHCLSSANTCKPIVIGFNPVAMARDEFLQDTQESFRKLLQQMDTGDIINPIIGPEPIAGSTRMKGGSATKIILDSVLMASLSSQAYKEEFSIGRHLQTTKASVHFLYQVLHCNLPLIISRCSNSFSHGGRIFYLSLDESGIWALLDAAECLPTYGVSPNDIRAFVVGTCGQFMGITDHDTVSANYFIENVLQTLKPVDTVLVTCLHNPAGSELRAVLLEIFKRTGCIVLCRFPCADVQLAKIGVCSSFEDFQEHAFTNYCKHVSLSGSEALRHAFLSELYMKLALNAVSTCTFASSGKVYSNIMIDMQLTNSKLFHRGVSIVAYVSGADVEFCKLCLLKALYRQDHLEGDVLSADSSRHITQAGKALQVIPIAILLAAQHCSVLEAENKLKHSKSLRVLLKQC